MNYPSRNYKKLQILEPFDEEFKNIHKSMIPLYSQKLIFVNSNSESDNTKIEDENEPQANHLDQKLTVKKEDCDGMFIGINNFKQLEGWLEDKDRINAFYDGILYNKYKFEQKIVYDIYSPYGLYGMFALKCQAKLVITTCQKNFGDLVRQIYIDNGFKEEQFIIIEESLANIDIDNLKHNKKELLHQMLVEKSLDCIVGEWFGSVLVNSSFARNIIDIRDKYVNKTTGFVFPNKGKLIMNFIEDEKYYNDRFSFWDDVYGFKMGNVKSIINQEAVMDFATPDIIQTYDYPFYEIGNLQNDLYSISSEN